MNGGSTPGYFNINGYTGGWVVLNEDKTLGTF